LEAWTRNKKGTHNYLKVSQSEFRCTCSALAAKKFWRHNWLHGFHR